jgi:glycosyltransferase involved in cell wall biosynthesis
MKVVLFAHVPPPHHGQSYMVQLLLEGCGGDRRKENVPSPAGVEQAAAEQIEFFHVNARLSDDLTEIGRAGLKKVLRLLRYILEALWCRFRFGAEHFFYVPAPPVRAAIYRDCIVMALCRPFFRSTIYHWHAIGLGDWLDREATTSERWLVERLLQAPTLSIVLGEYCRRDAQRLKSQRVIVVPNGIPDPCPAFETAILPMRLTRSAARKRLLAEPAITDSTAFKNNAHLFRVVFIGICSAEKGLFDALDAVELANRQLTEKRSPFRIHFSIAGKFHNEAERIEFERRLAAVELAGAVEYHGFVSGEAKKTLLLESDCLAFPTYYSAESFGLVLLEAMAYGLYIVTTNWRTIPEILPPGYPNVVEPRSPNQLAEAIIRLLASNYDPRLRARFLENYTEAAHLKNVRAALQTLTAAPSL